MRFTSPAYLVPYLSQTGFTASWNAFLSTSLTKVTPDASSFPIASLV
jgi:hypothetical protein